MRYLVNDSIPMPMIVKAPLDGLVMVYSGGVKGWRPQEKADASRIAFGHVITDGRYAGPCWWVSE